MRNGIALLKQTFKEFTEDKVPRLGAALAYYTIFSVGPLLLIAVAMAGIFLGQEAAQGRISGELGKVMGGNIAKSLEEVVKAAAKPKSGALATIVGVVTLLLGASGVFGQLKDALNTIWDVEKKATAGILGFIKDRFLSMTMVLGIGFLLLVSLMFDAVIFAMGDFIGARMPGGEAVLQIVQLVVSYAIVSVLFAAIFRVLPDLKIAWRDVWLGAALTAFLFVLGKFGLGLYLGKAAVGSSYGAAGSLIVLLVWVYWSAQILLFGAEFTQVYTRAHGSHARETKPVAVASSSVPVPAVPPRKRERGPRGAALPAIAGLIIGALVGGMTAFVVAIKSVKKLILAPFKLIR